MSNPSHFVLPMHLPTNHLIALQWFDKNRNQIQGWPDPIQDKTLLATKAKGIYKPQWSNYALSVRQSIDGPYDDKEPITDEGGNWLYKYYQEGKSPLERDRYFTNRGLMRCLNDRVPIGVIRQVDMRPRALYRICGLALVSEWKDGYFYLRGISL